MPQVKTSAKLTGSASWLAIVGAAFLWAWLDQCMFGPALLWAFPDDVAASAAVVMLAASVVGLFGAHLRYRDEESHGIWEIAPVAIAFSLGAVGCAACMAASWFQAHSLLYIGSAIVGLCIGWVQVPWGLVAVAQGPHKTMLHISGAWGLGLVSTWRFFLSSRWLIQSVRWFGP